MNPKILSICSMYSQVISQNIERKLERSLNPIYFINTHETNLNFIQILINQEININFLNFNGSYDNNLSYWNTNWSINFRNNQSNQEKSCRNLSNLMKNYSLIKLKR
ncbi:hypothetical protein ABPG74_018971 [Tetrahymena malaccensis]